MRRNEDELQESCVKWFKLQYPKLLITSFPAGYVFGGDRTKRMITGQRMKRMGYLPGIPDLLIPYPTRLHHGLFIELKCGKNKLSPEQKEVITRLMGAGYECRVCYCLEEFIRSVNEYIKGGIDGKSKEGRGREESFGRLPGM